MNALILTTFSALSLVITSTTALAIAKELPASDMAVTESALAKAIADSSAMAVTQRLGSGDKIITFSDLSMADGSPDDGTCMQRYGESFAAQSHLVSTSDIFKNNTDMMPDILVLSIGGSVNTGIFSIEDEYEVIYPDDQSRMPVDVEFAATGLVGSHEASGVISDGTCRGTLSITLAKDTAAQ
ncbi:hypothetical protein ACQU0X_22765 [Pseudovibrio ascidiaceicola]|uniref:hypothetical protein n=1 Tax=Pseudovibrio ascidiaceicola TaxID=285279 RepID=UPI003D35B278